MYAIVLIPHFYPTWKMALPQSTGKQPPGYIGRGAGDGGEPELSTVTTGLCSVCRILAATDDLLPLTSSKHGRAMLSQLWYVAAGDVAQQDVTVDTKQRDHLTALIKTLLDRENANLKKAWGYGVKRNVLMHGVRDTCDALNSLDRKAIETFIIRDKSII
jgi:hypothetical protein